MAIILSLETSTDVCSVAVHNNNINLAKAEVHQPQAHASRLAPLIEETILNAGITMAELNAVAVSSGPGSYTGLRIGTSTAKGICYALGLPLIAVSTLELLAFQTSLLIASENALLCPMIDARRMEVYCQVFDKDLRTILPVEAKVIDETSFQELLPDTKLFFFGNGAEKCKKVIMHEHAVFLDEVFPGAWALGLLANEKLQRNEIEDLSAFAPFYLKNFEAKKSKTLL